jgi:hypothetical protein
MNWKAKLLAGIRWAWNVVVYYANLVFDPKPRAIKWYVVAVLIIAVGGGIVFGPIFYGNAPASKPYALISPHDVIVSVPPPVPMPASASPKDLAPLTLLKVKDPSAKKKAAHKRRPKPRVSSARSDTRF